MSDVPAQPGIFQQLAGRWQVPLLLVSLAAVVAGVWRLRPEPQPAAFEPLFEHAVALHRAGLYTEASSYIDKLLIEPGRTESEKRKLFGLLARVVFDHEHGNLVHGPTNAARIIEYSNKSLAPGKSHDAATLKMRGLAWEWQRKAAQAVAEYQAAIELGAPDSWSLRKRVIEIRRHLGELDDDKLKAECEAFLAQGADGGQEGGQMPALPVRPWSETAAPGWTTSWPGGLPSRSWKFLPGRRSTKRRSGYWRHMRNGSATPRKKALTTTCKR